MFLLAEKHNLMATDCNSIHMSIDDNKIELATHNYNKEPTLQNLGIIFMKK